MGFISSDNILVFPCGRRESKYDITARLTTEYNLVSIINRLVDKESFLVTDIAFSTGFTTTSTTLFSFNIGGYLFTTSIADVFNAAGVTDTSTDVYAYISKNTLTLNEDGTINQELIELKAFNPPGTTILDGATYLDTASKFVGVAFDTSAPDPDTCLSLKLFEKHPDDGKWYFVEDSKIKFETNTNGTHRSVRIDDGELN